MLCLRRLAVLATLALLGPLPASSQTTPGPCLSEAHRAFDFWIGTWDVYRPNGQKVGVNEIGSAMGGCVLHERYSAGAYHGESFNTFDAARGVWHQTWVDNQGALLLLEGGVTDGAMILSGETTDAQGAKTLQRITWTRLEDDGTRVRQLWEVSNDGGQTWTVAFDGEYRRVAG